MKNKLAIAILTYNEEKNIRDCLASAAFADERIVIDSGSTDDTCAIASEMGAKVFMQPMTLGFAGQRNYALQCTQADWILYLDADERLTPELNAEIRKIVDGEATCAYEILRRNIAMGRKIGYGGHAPDYCRRLFPRTAVRWEGLVHEAAIVSLPLKKLTGVHMWHHTYVSWAQYFAKLDKYSTLMAQQMHDAGKRAGWGDLTLRPLGGFCKFYLLKQGWRDGRLGFVLAALHIAYVMMKYEKLFELQEEK